jgi:phenylpropionate dioxygenase-like ring-hydroxylating dioxygenase large terminal subunit
MQNTWQAIAIADAIKANRPYKIWLDNQPWVLFRDDQQQVRLVSDICPHRLASLSQGKIIQGEIQCPYHGWQFNHQGICTRVPGLEQKACDKPLLSTKTLIEHQGLIWACDSPSNFSAPLFAARDIPQDAFFLQTNLQSDLLTLIENFLDAFHTHFVHAGLIRHDNSRQTIQAQVKPLDDGIEVVYSGEKNQNGILSRWFEPERGQSFARFRLPNFAEIEYRSRDNRLSLLVSLWVVNARDNQLSVITRVATEKGIWPAWLKNAFLRRFARVILKQDQQIVETVYANKQQRLAQGLDIKTLNTQLDLLHPWLEQMISRQTPVVFDPYTREISV